MSSTYLHKQCSICSFWGLNYIFKKGKTDFFSCNNCRIIFINPLPTQEECAEKYQNYLKKFVSDEKYLKNTHDGAIRLKKRLYKEGQGLVKSNKQNKTLKLLDVGCGLGYFLKEMSTDFDVYGVEISSLQVDFARQKLGLNVFSGTLLEANFPNEYFDVVTMWEVIEHLLNPVEYIREINRILKPGGLLALSTPNFRGLTSIITKDKWHLCNPQEHLFYFSYHSLKNILSGNGFQIINVASDNINIPNIIRWLKKQDVVSSQIWDERKIYLRKIESNIFLKFLKKVINYFLNLSKKGDNLRIYAKKNSLAKEIKKKKNILILDNHGIGDVIVSIPLLKAIRDNFPDAKISLLLRSEVEKNVIEPLRLCNQYFYFHRFKKEFLNKKNNFLSAVELLWKLRKERFDIVINTQGVNMLLASLMAFFLGAKYRVGESLGWKGSLFNIKVFPMRTHRVYRNNNIGRAISINLFIPHPYLFIDKNAEISVDRIFEEKKLYGKKLIGIHIGNPKDQHERIWPVERYKELISLISQSSSDAVSVIFGSKAERSIVKEENITNMEGILNLVGELEIKETIAFIKRCKLFISSDSGLMHIAAALNVPTISIFGPTNSDVIAPYWNRCTIVRSNVSCSPCYDNEDFKKECENPICMSSIGAEKVYKSIIEKLEE